MTRRRNQIFRILGMTFFFCLLAVLSAQAQTPRILVVGDSWTPAMPSRIQSVLNGLGLGEYTAVGGSTTLGGTTAAQWASPSYLALITQELTDHPTIDIVHLSMGGNDMLGSSPSSPGGIHCTVEHHLR